jgi:hypothetical protein
MDSEKEQILQFFVYLIFVAHKVKAVLSNYPVPESGLRDISFSEGE